MKILITGGAGFIGSHITDACVRAGHAVTVMDNLATGKRENLNRRARFVRVDIREAAAARFIRGERFDLISHHAAQMDVRVSVRDPRYDADVNIMGLLRVLEAAAASRVGKVIFSSSGGTIYGESGARPPAEHSLPRPLSPYGVSKLASEHYLACFHALHGLRYTVLRYGNVYGPRQDPHGEAGVIAIFCSRMLAGKSVSVFGTGAQMRDYVFIGDVVRANMRALRRGTNDIINIGTGVPVSVNKLYAVMRRIGGFTTRVVRKPARAGELFKNYLDIRRARMRLGWEPRYDLSAGLAETVRYFREKGVS